MPLLILIILGSWVTFAQESSPKLDENKFTICAITINSDNEKKIFEAQAKKFPKKFNPVVELTNLGDDGDWFQKACSSGIQCDQLVISGHYAGSFFGDESTKTLDLEELEKAGCSKTCDGILKNPYEVFLMGCNTLSNKEEDHRTPAQYLQVLLNDGIPLAQAEMVVQSRYGEIGDSNKAGMQRAFGGENKLIYGFDSVGPSGKTVQQFLNNYFAKINAADHLDKLSAKRMLGQVEKANSMLAQSLKNTAFAQCNEADQTDEKNKNICKMVGNGTVDEKLAIAVDLLAREDYLTYLPVISKFFKENNPANFTDAQKETYAQIANNQVLKSQIIGLVDKTKGIGLKTEWINMARNFGYLTNEEASEKLMPEFEKIFSKPLTEQDMSQICNDDTNWSEFLTIKESNLKNKKIGINDIYAYDCLDIKDPETLNRVFSLDPKNDKDLKDSMFWMANDLPEGSRYPAWLKEHTIGQLNNEYEKEYAALVALKLFPTDPRLEAKSIQWLKEITPDNRGMEYFAMDFVEQTKTSNPTVIKELIRLSEFSNYKSKINEVLVPHAMTDANAKNFLLNQLSSTNNAYWEIHKPIINKLASEAVIDSDLQSAAKEYILKSPRNFYKKEWEAIMASGSLGLDPDIQKLYDENKSSLYDY